MIEFTGGKLAILAAFHDTVLAPFEVIMRASAILDELLFDLRKIANVAVPLPNASMVESLMTKLSENDQQPKAHDAPVFRINTSPDALPLGSITQNRHCLGYSDRGHLTNRQQEV